MLIVIYLHNFRNNIYVYIYIYIYIFCFFFSRLTFVSFGCLVLRMVFNFVKQFHIPYTCGVKPLFFDFVWFWWKISFYLNAVCNDYVFIFYKQCYSCWSSVCYFVRFLFFCYVPFALDFKNSDNHLYLIHIFFFFALFRKMFFVFLYNVRSQFRKS